MVSQRKTSENLGLVQESQMELMKYKALSENLEEKIAELKILESQILAQKNSQIQKLSSDFSLAESFSKNLNQKTGNLTPIKKIEILQKEIEIKNSKIRSLEKALREIEVFSIDLRENNQILQESIDGLKSENLYYEKLLDRKILAFGDLEKKLVIVEGFLGEIQGERDDLGRANGELLGLVEEGEAAMVAGERKFGDAQRDNRVLEDRLFELHQKFG
jgi:phosphopantetheinyl transferase (holo-ACP synthase)